jgi:exopolyphosphatase/guanosine-5'-triphosphate,3'-diphosphate pyrophosphatase
MRASVIDLGYNSLKMVSYETRPDDSFRAYEQRGSLTRLGEGLHQTGFLGQEAMERTLRELELLREVNRLSGIDRVIAIATSPIREAGNGYRFQREAESMLGVKFKVISGKEEALFSYIGAARATRLPNVLFFDLGGGSLEFTYAKGFRVRKTLSLPLGALRMSELYGRQGGRYSKKDYDKMRLRIAELLPTREELGLDDGTVLLGVGGTIRALAKYDQWIRDYPLNKLHNYRLRRKSILAINKRLRKMDSRKIAGVEALGRDRADSIAAGSLVISTIMNRLKFDEVVVSTHGLRDGVLSEYLRDPARYSLEEFDEARANSALAGWYGKETGTEVFSDALVSKGIVTLGEKLILDEAIESFLDLYLKTRPESLFYTILNEDSYLDHRDQIALALSLVRAKTPRTANWFYERYRSVLKDKSRESIDKLAAFIQVAEVLELTKSTARIRLRDGSIRFEVTTPQKDFPSLLLEQAARELEDATGRIVKTMIHRTKEREQVAPMEGR